MTGQQDREQHNRRIAWILGGIVALMFAFGYALIPLYNVFCELTGLNGKTGRIAAEEVAGVKADPDRIITVEFVTNVNGSLPWEFKALKAKMKVPVGALNEALFEASNFSSRTVTGQAVPSLSPGQAAKYFNKTECFCFTQQTLAAGESDEMEVHFIVDPKLPEYIKTVTLSYTFFEVLPSASVAGAGG
jgi:cytochrome c oxidase assembly protein subunit 11